jgi:hypothetical protein
MPQLRRLLISYHGTVPSYFSERLPAMQTMAVSTVPATQTHQEPSKASLSHTAFR